MGLLNGSQRLALQANYRVPSSFLANAIAPGWQFSDLPTLPDDWFSQVGEGREDMEPLQLEWHSSIVTIGTESGARDTHYEAQLRSVRHQDVFFQVPQLQCLQGPPSSSSCHAMHMPILTNGSAGEVPTGEQRDTKQSPRSSFGDLVYASSDGVMASSG